MTTEIKTVTFYALLSVLAVCSIVHDYIFYSHVFGLTPLGPFAALVDSLNTLLGY